MPSPNLRKQKRKQRGAPPPKKNGKPTNEGLLHLKVQALEQALEKLTNLYVANLEVIKQAFTYNDGHFVILQMVCNDVARGKVRATPLHPEEIEFHQHRKKQGLPIVDYYDHISGNITMARDQSVDLSWYHEKYSAFCKAMALIVWLKNTVGEEDASNS